MHKFGIRIPKSVQEAKMLDDSNGNTLWMDAIKKEMKNVRIAFEVYDRKIDDLKGFQHIDCLLIFDIKMSVERKER